LAAPVFPFLEGRTETLGLLTMPQVLRAADMTTEQNHTGFAADFADSQIPRRFASGGDHGMMSEAFQKQSIKIALIRIVVATN